MYQRWWLIVYPGQAHTLSMPSYEKDKLERDLGWFARYLTGVAGPEPAPGTARR